MTSSIEVQSTSTCVGKCVDNVVPSAGSQVSSVLNYVAQMFAGNNYSNIKLPTLTLPRKLSTDSSTGDAGGVVSGGSSGVLVVPDVGQSQGGDAGESTGEAVALYPTGLTAGAAATGGESLQAVLLATGQDEAAAVGTAVQVQAFNRTEILP